MRKYHHFAKKHQLLQLCHGLKTEQNESEKWYTASVDDSSLLRQGKKDTILFVFMK